LQLLGVALADDLIKVVFQAFHPSHGVPKLSIIHIGVYDGWHRIPTCFVVLKDQLRFISKVDRPCLERFNCLFQIDLISLPSWVSYRYLRFNNFKQHFRTIFRVYNVKAIRKLLTTSLVYLTYLSYSFWILLVVRCLLQSFHINSRP
jgi:hypothetical protein